MTRPDKITPETIKQHIADTAREHRNFGWKMFSLVCDLNINDTAAAKLFDCHPRTMKNYKLVERQRRAQLRDKHDTEVEDYSVE
jgi:hypothetical protein